MCISQRKGIRYDIKFYFIPTYSKLYYMTQKYLNIKKSQDRFNDNQINNKPTRLDLSAE